MFSVFVAGLVAAPMGAAMPDEQEKTPLVRATLVPRDARTVSLFSADVDIVGRLDHLGMTTVETSPERLAQLGESGMIEGYSIARPLHLLLDESTVTVQADVVNAQGRTGAGSAVVVIDSGINRDHPAFGDRIVAEACFLDGINGTCPSSGGTRTAVGPGTAHPCAASGCRHGTHVAGIVGSSDNDLPGVATGVDLVAVRITDNSGAIVSSDVLDALDWVLSIVETHAVVAVILSLGADEDPGACRDVAREAAVAALADAGVAVVAASGNSADDGLLPVAFPACLPGVVSVGATERSPGTGLAAGAAPELADFTQYDGVLDLVAPGVDIRSADTPGSGFVSLDGTSMAAPHVAGAFALLAGTQTA